MVLSNNEEMGSTGFTRYGYGWSEVGAFYWTVSAPDIVNSGRDEQGSISL